MVYVRSSFPTRPVREEHLKIWAKVSLLASLSVIPSLPSCCFQIFVENVSWDGSCRAELVFNKHPDSLPSAGECDDSVWAVRYWTCYWFCSINWYLVRKCEGENDENKERIKDFLSTEMVLMISRGICGPHSEPALIYSDLETDGWCNWLCYYIVTT